MDIVGVHNTPPAVTGGHGELVAEWLNTYLPEQIDAGNLTENTRHTYACATSRWLNYLACRDFPTAANIMAWISAMRSEGIKTSTITSYTAAIKSFYRWTEAAEQYPNIARSVRTPRLHKDSPLPAPSRSAISAMYRSIQANSLQGLRDRALLAVMYSTALRCISLVRAENGDVDLSTGTIKHQPKGHRAKDAIAVLSSTACEALADYLAARGPQRETDPLFAPVGNRHSRTGHLTTKSMRSLVLKLTEAAGLARRDAQGKIVNPGHYSAHSIRRAAVTEAAEKLGMDVAQTLAGHASVDTTRRAYARINRYRQLQATARILDL